MQPEFELEFQALTEAHYDPAAASAAVARALDTMDGRLDGVIITSHRVCVAMQAVLPLLTDLQQQRWQSAQKGASRAPPFRRVDTVCLW